MKKFIVPEVGHILPKMIIPKIGDGDRNERTVIYLARQGYDPL